MAIDYQDLLRRYIWIVGEIEGVDYTRDRYLTAEMMWGKKGPPYSFTDEERAELRKMSAEQPRPWGWDKP